MRERRVEREALVGASEGEEGFQQGPPALAGAMDIGGQMDLDNRSDFPELGKTGGVTTVGGSVCNNSHGFRVEAESGIMAMATPNEDCMQQGGGDVDGSTPRNGPKRWASVVAGSSESELEECPTVTVDKTGDEPTVVFPAKAYNKMEDQYRFAAVAGFYGGRSSIGVDYRYVFQNLRKLWVNVSRPTFSVIGNGRFLVRVNSEEELRVVLSRKWVVGGRFLIASRWKLGTEMRLLEEESIPLWIRLPQLPVLFWSSYNFKAIAQGLGASFVRADECTMHRDKLGFAWLCSDVPLNFKPVPKIKIEARENKISQEVIYESKVRFCRVCGTTSHYEEACKNKANDGTPVAEEQAWNKVLVIKKDGGGFHRNGSGGREPQANRFAIFSDQLDKLVGNDSLTDRQLETRPYLKFEDGGSTSKQQKEVKSAGEHESKKLEGCRECVEQGIEGAIDDEHNVRKQLSHALLMEEPILEEEVTAAMWSLDKDSAVGPNGFPNYFYHECWTMVRTDVVKAVQDFFTSGRIVRSVNETMICLIPKKENSKKVEDFKPISLCNSIYKIIMKVIVNRMRDILGRVINVNQATFLKVLVNGRMSEKFDGRRGLRQGDPLSPYLFLIVMEMFNRRITKETISKNILVPKIRCVGPNGCAMLFADDVIMLVKATKRTINTIDVILKDFEYFAGMKVNKQKSEIFVRTMVDCHMLEIQRILQWPNGDLPSEYLGLPLFLGNLTEDLCLPLLTKVEKREFKISVQEITCGRQDSQSFAIARSLEVSIDNIRLMETEDKLVWSEDCKAIFKAGEIVKKCRTQGVKE
ncbi:Transposon TX1 uncharacterized protein [Nymphaea thermarum]|nr:Transposon TX1 uncharacterized protein [Nymphaea thermarum]